MLITLRSWVRAPAEPFFFPFPFLDENQGNGVFDDAEEDVQVSSQSEEIFQNCERFGSNLLNQEDEENETASQNGEEEDTSDVSQPGSPENSDSENESSRPLEHPLYVIRDTRNLLDEITIPKDLLYKPENLPIIVEDQETDGEFTISFNSAQDGTTLHLTFLQWEVNNDDFDPEQEVSSSNPETIVGFEWTNIEEFRENFAEFILNSEDDIRTLYYIITGFFKKFKTEEVIYEFSQERTINMSIEAIEYWRKVSTTVSEVQCSRDIAQYIDDTEDLLGSLENRYKIVIEHIQEIIRNNRFDIIRRQFSNRIFQNNLQRMNENVVELISNVNESLVRYEEESCSRLQEKIEEVEEIINENKSNAIEIIEEQKQLIESSRNEIGELIKQVNENMEEIKQNLENKEDEFEEKLIEFKEMKIAIKEEVKENKAALVEYKEDTLRIKNEVKNAAEELSDQISTFTNNKNRRIASLDIKPFTENQLIEKTNENMNLILEGVRESTDRIKKFIK